VYLFDQLKGFINIYTLNVIASYPAAFTKVM
jgi:hypothetical protein